ncbi:MAG: radical SAM protein [Tissierellia bacterium]|nr:radical SAM protein [Tissierellia bacterium]
MSKINIIPIFVPHLGCPNDCVFCNQRRITGVSDYQKNEFIEKLNYFKEIFKSSTNDIEIAFYGGSFTAIDRKIQFELLEIAKDEKDKGNIDRIRISTRPDFINEEILQYLKKYEVDTIELGVQSLDEEVLRLSKRGHSSEVVYRSSELIKKNNFSLGLQQMVGLPGDDEKKSIDTALKIISMKPDFVRIYPTLVIKDTELEELFNKGLYEPLTLDEAISTVTNLMFLYESKNIPIIRIGLQSAPELRYDKDVIAGPLHDAFRELCESNKLFKILESVGSNVIDPISITSTGRNISLLVGQKGISKANIEKLFKTNKIAFEMDKKVDENTIIIKDDKSIFTVNINDEIKKIVEGCNNVLKEH